MPLYNTRVIDFSFARIHNERLRREAASSKQIAGLLLCSSRDKHNMDTAHPLSSVGAFTHWAIQARYQIIFRSDSVVQAIDNTSLWTLYSTDKILITPPLHHVANILQEWRPYLLAHPDFSAYTNSMDFFHKRCALCASMCQKNALDELTPCTFCHARRLDLMSIMRAAVLVSRVHSVIDITHCILRKLCDLAVHLQSQMTIKGQ